MCAKIRLGVIMRVASPALWGGPHREITLGLGLSLCRHPRTGDYLACVKGQYIKGLLRGWCERLEDLLRSHGVISSQGLTDEVFGGGRSPSAIPSPIIVADAYPITEEMQASELFRKGELSYLRDVKPPGVLLGMVPRVRIDDVSNRAAEEALFHEIRVAPDTLLYFEVVVRGVSEEKLADLARLLLISLKQLNYSYIGRTGSLGEVRVIGVEPDSLLDDEIVRLVIREG